MSAIQPIPAATVARSGGLSRAAVHGAAPVLGWAVLGSVFLALAAYIVLSWVFSPWFRPVPVGPDPLPFKVWLGVRGAESIATIAAIVCLWKLVLRPLFRTHDLPLDGLLAVNFLCLWWQDPLDNYVNFSFMYNGYALNLGSWANFIPGFGYPNHENFAEPLLMMGGFYLTFSLVNAIFGCWILRVLHEKYPRLHLAWRITAVFLAMAVIDLIVELSILRAGMAAYPGVVRSLTIFPGEVYQWPLYEAAIIGFVNTGWVCLRYFKDDKGRLFVERGIERLQLTKPKQRLLTFLAIAGFAQPFFLIAYFVPYNVFAIQADTIPAYPSYLRTEICGNGTAYACPSREWVPIPRRGGKLFITPDDPRLPPEVRATQGIRANDPYE
jgi:Spirocyclase AveC-like